jgi:SAM-dependent methyltransferase
MGEADGGALACRRCGTRFEERGGIYRFLSSRRTAAADPFQRQYRAVREREGYRSSAAEYYRRLPEVARGDPRAAEWRIRRESFTNLQWHAMPAKSDNGGRVLDLGAGNGWLSHRLASAGHGVAAVDRLDDEADGLGACRHYPHFAAVQADFDALPFEPSQFDLVVFNGSLHYSADPTATLAEARRMLAPLGAIAVMDSPMFQREQDGHAMVAEQLRQIETLSGTGAAIRPGVGFLTFDALERSARSLGLHGRFFRSHGPVLWRLRRRLSRLKLRRSPAAFGVWVDR